MRELIGSDKFTYIGDSASDLEIWKNCGSAVTVNTSPSLLKELDNHPLLVTTISDRQPKLKPLIKQMRIHQWAKNALLPLPMVDAKFKLNPFLQLWLGLPHSDSQPPVYDK